ncbi:MAG: garD [Ramlibacter sp.]|nr:garD [Ramlibacter sp.]
MNSTPRRIRMHEADNVAIVANDGGLAEGAAFEDGLVLRERVPQGHKVALADIPAGGEVRRYDVVIGRALKDIRAGSWVHERLLAMPEAASLEGLPMATAKSAPLAPLEGYTFEGYRNADGSVGTRNILAITQTVQCVAGVTDFAVDAQHQPQPQLRRRGDGGQPGMREAAARAPAAARQHPPRGPARRRQPGRGAAAGRRARRLHVHGGVHHATGRGAPEETGCAPARDRAGQRAGGRRAVRRQRRLLRRHRQSGGGVRDGVAQLTARATTPAVAEAVVREMAWYDAYLQRGSVDRSANTAPGNKAGGLSNIVEKAMGSIVKSGTAPISGVLAPGEKLPHKGLFYAATPASDFICGTLQLAAGMNLHVFTTGRGTPYGLAEVPVIKVATRSDLARRWHDLMDVNAGVIADGEATIEDVGWQLFRLMLEVASGRRKTWAEQWKLHNALVLFNPAPVT